MADFSVCPLLHASLCSLTHHTGRGSDRPLCHPASFSMGRGSFTLVSSERRVGPDWKTTFRSNFSQAFLICSLTPDTYGIVTTGGFSCGPSSSHYRMRTSKRKKTTSPLLSSRMATLYIHSLHLIHAETIYTNRRPR